MAAADHYADNDEETPCGAGGVHRCFCGLLRSATTALSRARSVLLTSRLIPLAMPHHIAAGQPREHYDCVNPLVSGHTRPRASVGPQAAGPRPAAGTRAPQRGWLAPQGACLAPCDCSPQYD